MKILKFTDNMPKLHVQTSAKLVYWSALRGYQLKHYLDLWKYDTLKSDGSLYKLKLDENYLVLFFVGDKGIMFSSIRKLNSENRHFITDMGKDFQIEIDCARKPDTAGDINNV